MLTGGGIFLEVVVVIVVVVVVDDVLKFSVEDEVEAAEVTVLTTDKVLLTVVLSV